MKKREYLEHEFNGSFDVAHTKVPVQDKLMQLSTVVNKDGSVTVSTDISLIFNQQRLENKLTASELREYIRHSGILISRYILLNWMMRLY